MKKIIAPIACCCLILVGCGEDAEESQTTSQSATSTVDNKTGNEVAQDTADSGSAKKSQHEPIRDYMKRFMRSYTSNADSLSKFVHPHIGLYVLDNPGAFHTVFHTDDMSFIEERDWIGPFDCTLEKSEIPSYSCENDSWSREGCFYNEFQGEVVVPLFELMVEYELTEGYDRSSAISVDGYITHEFRNTEAFTGAYFGLIDGEWYLLVLDLITPCSA